MSYFNNSQIRPFYISKFVIFQIRNVSHSKIWLFETLILIRTIVPLARETCLFTFKFSKNNTKTLSHCLINLRRRFTPQVWKENSAHRVYATDTRLTVVELRFQRDGEKKREKT